MMCVASYQCGCDRCVRRHLRRRQSVAIAEYGKMKRKWLARFLDLRSGIPSHDRFNAILAAIKPAEFEKCLLSWIAALHEISEGQVVAIDGKSLRRSFDAANGKAARRRRGDRRRMP